MSEHICEIKSSLYRAISWHVHKKHLSSFFSVCKYYIISQDLHLPGTYHHIFYIQITITAPQERHRHPCGARSSIEFHSMHSLAAIQKFQRTLQLNQKNSQFRFTLKWLEMRHAHYINSFSNQGYLNCSTRAIIINGTRRDSKWHASQFSIAIDFSY